MDKRLVGKWYKTDLGETLGKRENLHSLCTDKYKSCYVYHTDNGSENLICLSINITIIYMIFLFLYKIMN